jgi:hypothetical protein
MDRQNDAAFAEYRMCVLRAKSRQMRSMVTSQHHGECTMGIAYGGGNTACTLLFLDGCSAHCTSLHGCSYTMETWSAMPRAS